MNNLNHGFEYRSRLGADAAGVEVLDYLTLHHTQFGRDEWRERIHSARVLVNGMPAEERQVLERGQILSWVRPPWREPDAPCSFAILYRDDHLLATAKPSGLPTLPGGGGFMENTLLALVRKHFPTANPLHRLGRGTSGIVLFARTPQATASLFKAWRDGKVRKVYRALASGHPGSDEFTIDVPIGPVPHAVLSSIEGANPGGKAAHSRIRVLERRDSSSLVEVTIATGRAHQIRIHLAAAGHPLVGDPLYVPGGVPSEGSRALPSDLGYQLHNGLLGFPHPQTGLWTEIVCAPPPLLRTPRTGRDDHHE